MTGVQGCAEPTAPSGCWAKHPAGRPSGAPREEAIRAAPPGPEAVGRWMACLRSSRLQIQHEEDSGGLPKRGDRPQGHPPH